MLKSGDVAIQFEVIRLSIESTLTYIRLGAITLHQIIQFYKELYFIRLPVLKIPFVDITNSQHEQLL